MADTTEDDRSIDESTVATVATAEDENDVTSVQRKRRKSHGRIGIVWKFRPTAKSRHSSWNKPWIMLWCNPWGVQPEQGWGNNAFEVTDPSTQSLATAIGNLNETVAKMETSIGKLNTTVATMNENVTSSIARLDTSIGKLNTTVATMNENVTASITELGTTVATMNKNVTASITELGTTVATMNKSVTASIAGLSTTVATTNENATISIAGLNEAIASMDKNVTTSIEDLNRTVTVRDTNMTDSAVGVLKQCIKRDLVGSLFELSQVTNASNNNMRIMAERESRRMQQADTLSNQIAGLGRSLTNHTTTTNDRLSTIVRCLQRTKEFQLSARCGDAPPSPLSNTTVDAVQSPEQPTRRFEVARDISDDGALPGLEIERNIVDLVAAFVRRFPSRGMGVNH